MELEEKLKLLVENPDEDFLFIESLIPHVKQLSNEKKMLLMMDIQQNVYRHVYGTPQKLSLLSSPKGHNS